MTRFVFTYGSLLNPRSLSRTLPDVDPSECLPAILRNHRRTWTVAFRNDGSHTDKAYYDTSGHRPPFVLFINLEPSSPNQPGANGVLIPCNDRRLDLLSQRELRYSLTDVTHQIEPFPGHDLPQADTELEIVTFLGRPEFTRTEDVTQGVISREYMECIEEGVAHWDSRAPGFSERFWMSTAGRSFVPVRRLTRVDE